MLDRDRTARMTDEEWRGYITRAIESIDHRLADIDEKMEALNECVTGVKVKAAAIGGTVGMLVSIIGYFLGAAVKSLFGGRT